MLRGARPSLERSDSCTTTVSWGRTGEESCRGLGSTDVGESLEGAKTALSGYSQGLHSAFEWCVALIPWVKIPSVLRAEVSRTQRASYALNAEGSC